MLVDYLTSLVLKHPLAQEEPLRPVHLDLALKRLLETHQEDHKETDSLISLRMVVIFLELQKTQLLVPPRLGYFQILLLDQWLAAQHKDPELLPAVAYSALKQMIKPALRLQIFLVNQKSLMPQLLVVTQLNQVCSHRRLVEGLIQQA